ncbi:MAE_28990/MAE_18760 family HEPN-like nuclease [Gordonia sp. GONU]|uniref:MAE_28990/MAE_18760 family HEPN-like nuclease n=1 Tax=Gordonia sp. GONU TaxID=2972949 RepID=UPI0021AD0E13|nr:MAE_28990/MAE_18760 family HEPN-like nuclease [Gordonia sp. GONU]MCR8898272.1 MAE_28990/MAE_18760 family HEPN-like nuclease [Gordonia sp. GONU]
MIDDYFGAIDASRSRRVRELSDTKLLLGTWSGVADPFGVRSKAIVVLCYSHWEGFYNECVDNYCDFLRASDKTVTDVAWEMMVGSLDRHFEVLRSRNHSRAARREFVTSLRTTLTAKFDAFDRKSVKSRSNLDWDKLTENFLILGFDTSSLLRHRNRIQHELVGWRHAVAHGNSPNLEALDVESHIELTGNVMTIVADTFQAAMVAHI